MALEPVKATDPNAAAPPTGYDVRIARNFEDMAKILSIRSAVYMAEQRCPYEEEFDGNDFCGMHLLGSMDGEPVASLRMRFFADFAKIERLAVRQAFRRSSIAFRVVRQGIDICRRKGYTRIYGHAREGLVDFWARFGARPMTGRPGLTFSDFDYTEMLLELPRVTDAISLGCSAYQLIRPEGAWDIPGVLERSATRAPSPATVAAKK